ncbi:17353_t:CDS:1, partial [Gigaspora margarita]
FDRGSQSPYKKKKYGSNLVCSFDEKNTKSENTNETNELFSINSCYHSDILIPEDNKKAFE